MQTHTISHISHKISSQRHAIILFIYDLNQKIIHYEAVLFLWEIHVATHLMHQYYRIECICIFQSVLDLGNFEFKIWATIRPTIHAVYDKEVVCTDRHFSMV